MLGIDFRNLSPPSSLAARGSSSPSSSFRVQPDVPRAPSPDSCASLGVSREQESHPRSARTCIHPKHTKVSIVCPRMYMDEHAE